MPHLLKNTSSITFPFGGLHKCAVCVMRLISSRRLDIWIVDWKVAPCFIPLITLFRMSGSLLILSIVPPLMLDHSSHWSVRFCWIVCYTWCMLMSWYGIACHIPCDIDNFCDFVSCFAVFHSDNLLNTGHNGLLIMNYCWHFLQWVIHSACILLEAHNLFLHCSLTSIIVTIGFPDHVISVRECLAQSYTVIHSHLLLFRLWHPDVPNFENNKIHRTEQTLVPFIISIHWLSACVRTYFCPCLPYIPAYSQTWRLTWYYIVAWFGGCWKSLLTLKLYHTECFESTLFINPSSQ
jgi:hypothetical protein